MLRPLIVLVFIAGALALAGGCNKSQKTAAPPPGKVTATFPPSPSPNDLEGKEDEALKKSGISDEMRTEYISELEKQSSRYGFELSADKEFLKAKDSPEAGLPILAVVTEAASLQEAPQPAGKVKLYLERLKERTAQDKKVQEELQKGLERIDHGEIMLGLAPSADPGGDWQSIGETREGEKHFLVEHDGNYYKLLNVNKEGKTLHIQEIKDGKVERDVSLPYKYDAKLGELTTTSAGGGAGDAFSVMQLEDYPDRLFVRPLYDTVWAYTVYRRLGVNPHAAPKVEAYSTPSSESKSGK